MEKAIVELLDKFGLPSIWTLIIVIITKFIAKPIFDAYMEIKKENQKSKLQSNLEMENKLKSNTLEFDKYKKDTVIPVLQSIANLLEEDLNVIQEYSNYFIQDNKLGLKEERNNFDEFRMKENEEKLKEIRKSRENIVRELRKEILKISIYLPKEIRDILLVFRVSMENQLLNSKKISSLISIELDVQTTLMLATYNMKIYRLLLNCFYKLVEEYIEIGYEKIDYLKIITKHGLDEHGYYIIVSEDIIEKISAIDVLAVTRRDKEETTQILKKINELNGNEDF